MKQLKALILAAATLLMAQAHAATDAQNDKIAERIKPVGTVCVGGLYRLSQHGRSGCSKER